MPNVFRDEASHLDPALAEAESALDTQVDFEVSTTETSATATEV